MRHSACISVCPQYIRSGRTSTVILTYANNSANDIVAPLLDITTTNTSTYFSTSDDPNDYMQHAQILAVAPSGPAGVLRPGQSGQITLTIQSNDLVDNDLIPVQVSQIEAGQTIDWASDEAALATSAAFRTRPGMPFMAICLPCWADDRFLQRRARAGRRPTSAVWATPPPRSAMSARTLLVPDRPGRRRVPNDAADVAAVDASLSTPGNLSLAIDRTFASSHGRSLHAGYLWPGLDDLLANARSASTPRATSRSTPADALGYFASRPTAPTWIPTAKTAR